MPSNYASFDVKVDNRNGTYTYLPNAQVKIYQTSNGALLATVAANANGVVPSGTLNVAAGTQIHYTAETAVHQVGYGEQVTT